MRVKSSLLKWLVILLFVSELAKSDSFYNLESRSSTYSRRNRSDLSTKSPFLQTIRHGKLDRRSSAKTLNDVTDFKNSFATFRTRVEPKASRAKDIAINQSFRLDFQKSDVLKKKNYRKERLIFENKIDGKLFQKTRNTAIQENRRSRLIRNKELESSDIRNVRSKMIIDNSRQSRSRNSFDHYRKSLVRRQYLRQVQEKRIIPERKFYVVSAREKRDTKQMLMKTTSNDMKHSEARLYSFEIFPTSSQRNSISRIQESGVAKDNLRINRRNSQTSTTSLLRSGYDARNSGRRINLSDLIITPDRKNSINLQRDRNNQKYVIPSGRIHSGRRKKHLNRRNKIFNGLVLFNGNPVYENKERLTQGQEFEVPIVSKKMVTESRRTIFKKISLNILKHDSRSIFSVRQSITQRFSRTGKPISAENVSTQHYRRKSLSNDLRRNARRDNNAKISNNNMESNALQDKERKETNFGHQTGKKYQRMLHSRSNGWQNDQQRWNIKSDDEIKTIISGQNFGVQKIDLNRNLRIQNFRKSSGLYSRKTENTINSASQRLLNDKIGKKSRCVKESKGLFSTSQNDERAYKKQMSRGRLHVADKQARKNFKNSRNEQTRGNINDLHPLTDRTFYKTFYEIRKRRDNSVVRRNALYTVRSSKELTLKVLMRNGRKEHYTSTSRRTEKTSQDMEKIQNDPNEKLFTGNNIGNENNLRKFRNIDRTILSRRNRKRFGGTPSEERHASHKRWTSTNDFGIRKFERIGLHNLENRHFQSSDTAILNYRNGRGFRGKSLEKRYAGHERRTSRNHLGTRENNRLGNRISVLRRKDYLKTQDNNTDKRKVFINIRREFLRKESRLRFGNNMNGLIATQKTAVMRNDKINRMTANNKNFPSEQMQLIRISANVDSNRRQRREIPVSNLRTQKYITSPTKQISQKDKDYRKFLFREQKLDVQMHRTSVTKNKRLLYRQSRNLQISRRENSRTLRSYTTSKRFDMRNVYEAQFTTQRQFGVRLHSEIRSQKIKNSLQKVYLLNYRFSNQFVSTISLDKRRFSRFRTEGYRKVSLMQQTTILIEKNLPFFGSRTLINNCMLQFKNTFSEKFYLSEKVTTRYYKVNSLKKSSVTKTIVSPAFYGQQNSFKPNLFADVKNNIHLPNSQIIFSKLENSKQNLRVLRTFNGASSQIRIVNDVHSHHYQRTMFHHFHVFPAKTVNIRARSSYFSFPVSQRRNEVLRMRNKSIRLSKRYTLFEPNHIGNSFSRSHNNRNIRLTKAATDSGKTSPLHECFIELPMHHIASCISFKSNFSHNEGTNIFRPHMKSRILSISRSSTKSSKARDLPENNSLPVNLFLSFTDVKPQAHWFESIILRKSNIISFFSNIVMGLGILMAVSDDRKKGIQSRFRNRLYNCIDRFLTLA